MFIDGTPRCEEKARKFVHLFVVVVVAALQDMDASVFDFIDEAVLFVDGAAVPCCEVTFQRLRMSKPAIAVAFDVGEQLIDFLERLFVLRLPVHVIVPASADECNVAHLAIASSSSMVFVT